MSNLIYEQDWTSDFSWIAIEDCWIFAVGDTKGDISKAAQINLNNSAVCSTCITDSITSQSSAFFPCRKGDVVSKTTHGRTVAKFRAYAML